LKRIVEAFYIFWNGIRSWRCRKVGEWNVVCTM